MRLACSELLVLNCVLRQEPLSLQNIRSCHFEFLKECSLLGTAHRLLFGSNLPLLCLKIKLEQILIPYYHLRKLGVQKVQLAIHEYDLKLCHHEDV